jgi:DNA (cytosine-5)-methyltransferase 1
VTNALTVGSLFAGIGGFDLGLERAGFEIAWQVEIDPYCQRVLAKHWPHVQRYGDIQSVDWGTVEPVDVLCGGFPCQDISFAGKGAGLAGERSGLWFEYAKAIEALTPRYVIIENVAALRSRGLDQVLGSLAALGYDAEWHCIPASAIGAPHRRDRVWIIAYTASAGLEGARNVQSTYGNEKTGLFGCVGENVADIGCLSARGSTGSGETKGGRAFGELTGRGWWQSEPDVGRVAYGVPHRVDRLKGLGNAIVPQIAEMIGAWILLREEVSV